MIEHSNVYDVLPEVTLSIFTTIYQQDLETEYIGETHQFFEGMSWMKKRSKMKLTTFFQQKRSEINEMLTLTINALHFRNVNR